MPLTRVSAATFGDTFTTDFLGEVSSESALLLLRGEYGDWAIRTDLGREAFIIISGDGSNINHWKAITNNDELETFALGGL